MTPGYKQTDVGVIPDDWNLADLDTVGSVIDGDRGANYPSSEDFSASGYCLFAKISTTRRRFSLSTSFQPFS